MLALVVVFAGISFWQAWEIARHLSSQSRETSRIYGRVVAALVDQREEAETEALLALIRDIRETRLPLVVTDTAGRPTAAANLPDSADIDHPGIHEFVANLDRTNAPLQVPGVGRIHFGSLPVARRLTWLAVFQVGTLATAVAVGLWAYRASVHRHRDRVWVGMARESAHQLGTPLMSAGAWVDRLADGATEPAEIARYLRADLERLQRVAQRFERIGRPARRDQVGLGALAERVAAYFQPRLPRHASPITLKVEAAAAGPTITADAALLEWAIEALVRNAIDALSGVGGQITMTVSGTADQARISVADDGPGVPPELRSRIFEPGVSTKSGGWGIGLALARRIVEDVHGGRVDLTASERGATFVAELPRVGRVDVDDDDD